MPTLRSCPHRDTNTGQSAATHGQNTAIQIPAQIRVVLLVVRASAEQCCCGVSVMIRCPQWTTVSIRLRTASRLNAADG
eukprot:7380577-Prymnesium_polylepis.1